MQGDWSSEHGGRPAETHEQRLKNFHTARQHLAEQRGSLIRTLAGSFQREQSEAHIDLIIKLQSAIEVIDKAIGEEQTASQRA